MTKPRQRDELVLVGLGQYRAMLGDGRAEEECRRSAIEVAVNHAVRDWEAHTASLSAEWAAREKALQSEIVATRASLSDCERAAIGMAEQRDAATERLNLAIEEIRNCARERDAALARAKEFEAVAREAQRGRHEAAAALAASQALCARLADALSTMVLAAHGRD